MIKFKKIKAKVHSDDKVEEEVLGRLRYSNHSENVWS